MVGHVKGGRRHFITADMLMNAWIKYCWEKREDYFVTKAVLIIQIKSELYVY